MEDIDYVIFTCNCSSCLESPVAQFLFQAAEATAGSNDLFRLINRTTADAKGVYAFRNGNQLEIKRIRKPQEGKYCCAIKGERSNELSLILKTGTRLTYQRVSVTVLLFCRLSLFSSASKELLFARRRFLRIAYFTKKGSS